MVIVTTTFRQPGKYPAIARGFFVSEVSGAWGEAFTCAMTPPQARRTAYMAICSVSTRYLSYWR